MVVVVDGVLSTWLMTGMQQGYNENAAVAPHYLYI